MLQFLTNGHYDESTGLFITPNQQHRYYFASDNVQSDSFKGLSPEDLIDIAMFHGIHFDGATQKGVVFNMIGALSQYGRWGWFVLVNLLMKPTRITIKPLKCCLQKPGNADTRNNFSC